MMPQILPPPPRPPICSRSREASGIKIMTNASVTRAEDEGR